MLDDNICQVVVKHFGSNTWYFQDDSALCHFSNESENWEHLNKNHILSPQCTELSPIKKRIYSKLKNLNQK